MNDNINRRLTVLYGSQTGTAQEVAERISRDAKRMHFQVKLSALDDYQVNNLPHEHLVIFVVSTTGQGDPPENMTNFWKFIMRRSLAGNVLSAVQFAVVGLGDSSYPKFNFVAKKLHRRLLQLNATEMHHRGLADDQSTNGIEDCLIPWMDTLWIKLLERYPVPSHLQVIPATALPPTRYGINLSSQQPESTILSDDRPYSATNPFQSRILENTKLTSSDHFQDVRHIAFNISNRSGKPAFKYEPGDVLAMWPKNNPDSVMQILNRLKIDPDQTIEISKQDQDAPDVHVPTQSHGATVLVRAYDLFEQALNINGTPKRYFFELLSHFTNDEDEKDRLQYFGSSEGAGDLNRYAHKEKRTFVEALQDFPLANPPLNYVLDLIPPIQPRYFSISSSQLMYPTQVHITVSVVKFTTPYKRVRHGICSSWLSTLTDIHKGLSVSIWLKKGTMKFPPAEAPVILVGPGTGMAPFRSLIQDRAMLAAQGKQVGQTVFFFGNRNKNGDYLYGSEFERYMQEKKFDLSVITAFSRDQPNKIYVQHRIKENSKLIWDLIHNKGAIIYIAGNANQMPTNVRDALKVIVKQEGLVSDDQAEQYVCKMEQLRRFQQETWS